MTAAEPRPRVLIVEDEAKTASTIALYLRHEGMEVGVATDGARGLEMAQGGGWDLLILDRMLPGVDGMEICRRLRAAEAGGARVPVILVTARTAESERVEGLDGGADDYVPKPFSPRELVARVKAHLRRARAGGSARQGGEAEGGTIRHGALHLDLGRRQVRLGEREISLTAAELDLLAALAERPGVVWSRERLLERLSGDAFERDPRTIDAHVKNLRRKLETDRRRPRWVKTVFGVGYKLAVPDGAGVADAGGDDEDA